MELLVATWTLRVAVIAAAAVGIASWQAGAPALDCVDRALFAAVGFTFAGRWLAGWLEPPGRRMLRMRRQREARRARTGGKARASTANERAAAALQARTASTISRSA